MMKTRLAAVFAACLGVIVLARSTAPDGAQRAESGRLRSASASLDGAQRAEWGPVRLNGRVLADDRGPFLGLGASLFWGVWGYGHDRARLVQHFDVLRSHGFNFVRVLGVVTGPSWDDRAADPQAPGYDEAIAGLTDLAFAHGLRLAWTIFGDTVAVPNAASRLSVIDRFVAMATGRDQKILYVEIANEGWLTGFGGNLGELEDLARYLKRRTTLLVTSTSLPPLGCGPTLESLYGPGAADFLVLHFDRNIGTPDGPWGPVRQPINWSSRVGTCREKLPVAAANGEPIGPQSSVASEEDPLRLATGAVVTYTAGLPIYALHTGPGVRGGGKADQALRRAASLMDLPRIGELLHAFAALKQYLPPDLPGWSRFEARGAEGPVQIRATAPERSPVNMAAARRGDEFVVVPFGIRDSLVLEAAAATRVEVIHPGTGVRLLQQKLARGGKMELPPGVDALVIIGRAP